MNHFCKCSTRLYSSHDQFAANLATPVYPGKQYQHPYPYPSPAIFFAYGSTRQLKYFNSSPCKYMKQV